MFLERTLLGGGLAALLLIAAGAPSLAQTAPPAAGDPAPAAANAKSASAKPAKPAPSKIAAEKHERAKKAAAASKKPEAKKVAAAKKPEPKKLAAAKKPEPKKLAAAKKPAPVKVAAAPKPLPAAYTITTTRNHVTYTETRVVPLPGSTVSPPVAQIAAVPQAESAAAPVAKLAAAPVSAAPQPQSATPPVKHEEPAPSAAAAQPADPSAANFVSAFLHDAFRIARSAGTTTLQRRAQLADLFSSKMDVGRIAGYTAGEELTGTAPDFQKRFRTILISYLVETYYPRLELASDPTVKVETTAAPLLSDGTAVVWTTFSKEGWGSQSVQWHLAPENGGYKVVDIMTAGASVMQMERDTFQSVMRNGGLPELMARLDARTKSLAMAATE